MNFSFSSLFRNLLHIGGGGTMLYWLLGLFGVTQPMVSGAIGAISTLVTIGATIWSQIHANSVAPVPSGTVPGSRSTYS